MKTVKVMSYNIHSGVGLDDKIDYNRMSDLIGRQTPDLIGFQEVAQDYPRSRGIYPLQVLGEKNSMKGEFGRTIRVRREGLSEYDYGIGFLSRYPYELLKKAELPNMDSREPRVCLISRVHGPADFIFAVTHLDCSPDDSPTAGLRRQQFLAIDREIKALEEGLPCILVGDFNAEPGSGCINALKGSWKLTDDSLCTFPADAPRIKIDFIAFRGNLKFHDFQVVDEKVISDHRPVTATFEI